MHICMNWSALTFDWNQARAFLATAEAGSFSAAARALGMTQPTLGRQVAAFEAALDIVLFERVGRRLILTPAGGDLLTHIRGMGEAALHASLTASGRAQSIGGEVCLSVTDIFAHYTMPLIAADLRRLAPQISLRILAENTLSDLQRREADIAVRHVAPTQPDLIARKVRETTGHLYATADYIDRHGPFDRPGDIAGATILAMGTGDEMLDFLTGWGLPITAANIGVKCDNGTSMWEMARRGLGIVAMSRDLADHFPDMRMVLPQMKPIPIPYWLTVHRELHSSRRIRLVYDRLAETLKARNLPILG